MILQTAIQNQRSDEARNPSMKLRLWVHGNQGWGVQYYSQNFLSFKAKISIARNHAAWAIERTSDGIIIAQQSSGFFTR